jgi:hypothetical protein
MREAVTGRATASGFSRIDDGQVEHLEDALEAHQRRHHVDADVGEPLQGPEQTEQQRGQRQEGADRQLALDREVAAHAVDEGGRQRGHGHHRCAEDAGDQGDAHAEVAHSGRLAGEQGVLVGASAEQPEQHRATDVEPLGHHVAHVGVAVHLLAGEPRELAADDARGEEQEREQQQARERDLPAQRDHGNADHDDRDRVGDGAGQRGGECPLRPDHVVVETRDERAGLGAGEEGQRLSLHVGEHLGAQVVDQTLADA